MSHAIEAGLDHLDPRLRVPLPYGQALSHRTPALLINTILIKSGISEGSSKQVATRVFYRLRVGVLEVRHPH